MLARDCWQKLGTVATNLDVGAWASWSRSATLSSRLQSCVESHRPLCPNFVQRGAHVHVLPSAWLPSFFDEKLRRSGTCLLGVANGAISHDACLPHTPPPLRRPTVTAGSANGRADVAAFGPLEPHRSAGGCHHLGDEHLPELPATEVARSERLRRCLTEVRGGCCCLRDWPAACQKMTQDGLELHACKLRK